MFDKNLNKNLETVKINLSEIIEAGEYYITEKLYDRNISCYIMENNVEIQITANNKNYIIIADKISNNYDNIKVQLGGDINGNIVLKSNKNYECTLKREGEGNGHAILIGSGYGNAIRYGEGHGNAIKSGSDFGRALRYGEGNGHAIRLGSGKGNAARYNEGNGHAVKLGSGKGGAYRSNEGHGHAIRSGSGKGVASRYDEGHGHAIRSGSDNEGNAFKIINI